MVQVKKSYRYYGRMGDNLRISYEEFPLRPLEMFKRILGMDKDLLFMMGGCALVLLVFGLTIYFRSGAF